MSYQIATYAQSHPSAGRWVQDWDAETDSQSDDYIVYEGTREEILSHANAADARAAQSGAGDDLYWWRVARSIREGVEREIPSNSNMHVCELCGKEFHALECLDDDWVDADGDVVGYAMPIHEDDPLHEGAESGTVCWRCGHEYMDESIGECIQCGDYFAWARDEHCDLLAANYDVVGRRTPDGPICAACDCDTE